MKKFNWLLLVLIVYAGSVYSQLGGNRSITLNPDQTAMVEQINSSSYGFGGMGIGKVITYGTTFIDRKWFKFNLSAIPDNATISQVQVNYSTGIIGYKLKLTKVSSVNGDAQTQWNAVGTGNLLHTDIDYALNASLNSNPIKDAIANALGSNELIIGALSQAENIDGSMTPLTLTLYVDYTVPPLHITVRNDLYGADGGNIGVGIYPNAAVSHPSPYSDFTIYQDNRLNLAAYDNQSVNGKVWFFNNTEYQSQRSEWREKKVGVFDVQLSLAQSFTTSPLTESDDYITITAFLNSTDYTTSGTMSSNETWFTPVTLAGNVTIASGVTLKIASGTTVTLNGNYIKCTGSGKIENHGDITGYLTYAQDGIYYKGYFPPSTTLQQILSWASSGWNIILGSGTYTNSDNLTVNTGITLTVNSGATVNLNGYHIKCTGSGKIIKNGTINGYTSYAQSGSDYKGFFPASTTVQQILSWASSGWNIVLPSGTYDNSDHLTVNSGITLTINPGVTLKFASGKKLTINGTIAATGTSSQKITFQANSGTWYGIEVNYGGNTAFNYCNIKNATCGIRGYQTSNLTLEHCEITNNTNGVTYTNQSSGYVRYSKINSNLGNSGINCAQNSNPIIRPHNQLKYNAPAGLDGDYNSLPELGSWANYGYNSISNSYDDVYSNNSNTIYALYNYWGSSSPDPSVSDNIEWEPYLTSDPNGGSLNKLLAENPGSADRDTTGQTEFAKAYQAYLKEDYALAIPLFQEIVQKYPDHANGGQALGLINQCYQKTEKNTDALNYLEQVQNSFTDKKVSQLARSIAVGHLVRQGDYSSAITNCEQILAANTDSILTKYALYDLGNIYWYFQHDPKTGEKYYRQLIETWPKDQLAQSALATLGEAIPDTPRKPQPADAAAVVTDHLTLQTFPNPFNPTTAIQFNLPEAGKVTVTIYDLQGRQIARLLDEPRETGLQIIRWNGQNEFGVPAASGTYFCHLRFKNQVLNQKIILLK